MTADGIFGPGTETALKDYQKKHGLMVDGVAGPDTFAQMGLYELVLLAPGTAGEAVKKLQQALGVTADGRFGPGDPEGAARVSVQERSRRRRSRRSGDAREDEQFQRNDGGSCQEI